jgi:hypothetical protein
VLEEISQRPTDPSGGIPCSLSSVTFQFIWKFLRRWCDLLQRNSLSEPVLVPQGFRGTLADDDAGSHGIAGGHAPRQVVTDDRLTHLLFALDAERARGYSAGKLFVDSIETALANILLTSFNTFTPRSIPGKGGMAPHVLRRVVEFMHANIDKQIGLKDLAGCAGLLRGC